MVPKREDQEGDVVDLTPIKRKMNAQEGGNAGASLFIISFNW